MALPLLAPPLSGCGDTGGAALEVLTDQFAQGFGGSAAQRAVAEFVVLVAQAEQLGQIVDRSAVAQLRQQIGDDDAKTRDVGASVGNAIAFERPNERDYGCRPQFKET